MKHIIIILQFVILFSCASDTEKVEILEKEKTLTKLSPKFTKGQYDFIPETGVKLYYNSPKSNHIHFITTSKIDTISSKNQTYQLLYKEVYDAQGESTTPIQEFVRKSNDTLYHHFEGEGEYIDFLISLRSKWNHQNEWRNETCTVIDTNSSIETPVFKWDNLTKVQVENHTQSGDTLLSTTFFYYHKNYGHVVTATSDSVINLFVEKIEEP